MSDVNQVQIEDKTKRPTGAVPKNVQAWLMVGISVVMVLVIWISGGTKRPAPKPTAKIPPPSVSTGGESKIAEITELERRIAEQQRLNRALAEQQKQLGQPVNPQAGVPTESVPVEDPVAADKKKRNYLSNYASNVALTFRQSQDARSNGSTASSSDPDPNQIVPFTPAQLAEYQQLTAGQIQPLKSEAAAATKPEERKTTTRFNSEQGKSYVLFEGNVLETVLMNRLSGDFSGPVSCMVTTPVYSLDRQHVLIPAGTKVLGEAKKVDGFGQTRLAIVFHRLIMPDGYSVDLDQFRGLNQIGETGLKDQVNNHYFRVFGASLAIGAIGGLAEAGTRGPGVGASQSATDTYRQGIASSLSQSSLQALDKFLNLLPTVTIREGHRVKVYLTGDLLLPDYQNHTIPSNL